MKHRLDAEDGVSIVEVMLAMVVLSVVLAALASALVTSLHAVQRQERRTAAVAVSNEMMEGLQSRSFRAAALCTPDATSHFGGTDFEGEPLVLDNSVCGTPEEIVNPTVVTRNGIDFTIERALTWNDDPGDSTGAADPDTPQDLKRLVVDVSWDDLSGPQSARVSSYHADTAGEQIIQAEVVAVDGGRFVDIDDDAAADGENDESFDLTLVSEEKLTSAKVEWVDRNGTPVLINLVSPDSQNLVWTRRLLANFGPFANGNTLFTFTATFPDGTTDEIITRALFLYQLAYLDGSLTRNFDALLVHPTQGVCPGQTVQVDFEGLLRSDSVDGVWSKGPTLETPFVSIDAPAAVAVRGARFKIELQGNLNFLDVARDVTDPSTTLKIRATRAVDLAVFEVTSDPIPVLEVLACPA